MEPPASKDLSAIIGGPIFSRTARVAIMVGLLGMRRVWYSELLLSLGIPKSSLTMHLRSLESEGLLTVRRGFTISGFRTYVEITEKGEQEIRAYLVRLHRALDEIAPGAIGPERSPTPPANSPK